MKTSYYLPLLSCAVILLAGCGPSKGSLASANPPLDPYAEVVVLEVGSPALEGITPIGRIKTEYSKSSTCGTYDETVAQAQQRSRAKGGNLIQITKHATPHTMASWHKIWANVYRVADDELDGYRPPEPEFDQALFDEGCAILYFYRSRTFQGVLIDYNVKIGEEVVWRARHNDKEWIKVKAVGPVELTAKTEAKTTLDLDIQPGRSYYIKCDLGMGLLVGRPTLLHMNEASGKYEYEQIVKN